MEKIKNTLFNMVVHSHHLKVSKVLISANDTIYVNNELACYINYPYRNLLIKRFKCSLVSSSVFSKLGVDCSEDLLYVYTPTDFIGKLLLYVTKVFY